MYVPKSLWVTTPPTHKETSLRESWNIIIFSKGLVAWWHCLFCSFLLRFYRTLQSSISSSPVSLVGKNHPGVPSRQSNSDLPYNKPTLYQLSYAAPYWATPHPSELSRSLNCATPHPLFLIYITALPEVSNLIACFPVFFKPALHLVSRLQWLSNRSQCSCVILSCLLSHIFCPLAVRCFRPWSCWCHACKIYSTSLSWPHICFCFCFFSWLPYLLNHALSGCYGCSCCCHGCQMSSLLSMSTLVDINAANVCTDWHGCLPFSVLAILVCQNRSPHVHPCNHDCLPVLPCPRRNSWLSMTCSCKPTAHAGNDITLAMMTTVLYLSCSRWQWLL